ncbi:MAG: hypothetical protein Q8K63_04165 [Acidimicrobiales bacterium]|nr:hypothetical protein [Acidimicrobiales bacterium]
MIGHVTKLIGRTQLTRGRLLFLLGMGALALLLGFAVSVESGAKNYQDTIEAVANGYGLHVFAPIVALVLASAALGDLVDDRTLVYLWLRPVPRWQIALGAACSSIGTAVPIVVVPMALAAALASGNATAVFATAAATSVATIGYAGLFLALGFKVRRALVWGLAYILIWEEFLARGVGVAAKLSIGVYANSLLNHIADLEGPKHGAGPLASFLVPTIVALVAIALTARWLKTTEVA